MNVERLETNQVIVDEWDKFTNTRSRRSQQAVTRAVGPGLDYLLLLRPRYIETQDAGLLVFDVDATFHDDWMHLDEGDLVFHVNGENVVCPPREHHSDHEWGMGDRALCKERLFYEVSQQGLRKICSANSVDLRISGRATRQDFSLGPEDLAVLRRFYFSIFGDAFEDSMVVPKRSSSAPAKDNTLKSLALLGALLALLGVVLWFAL